MDQQSSNTLRTLGIVLTSIFLFTASGILLLASMCFGLMSLADKPVPNAPVAGIAFGCLVFAGLLIFAGITIIAKLSRGIIRDTQPSPAYSPSAYTDPVPAEFEKPAVFIDYAHLSPSSRAAMQHLFIAISALILVDLLLAFVPGVVHTTLPFNPRQPLLLYNVIYRVLALAPYVIVLFALYQSPSPRSFAYALAIPAIPAIWGLLALPVSLILLISIHGPLLYSTLLQIPVLIMDFVVLYHAWIAIKRTGIYPSPKRLIIASVVMFVYRVAFAGVAGALIAMTTTILHG